MIRICTLLFAVTIGLTQSCQAARPPFLQPEAVAQKNYQTRHVVIVVVDGPRYSETWGSKDHALVPHLKNDLLTEGVINDHFFNDGYTYTNSGHAALTTGVRQPIDNSGNELPKNPSLFQLWLEKTGSPPQRAWIVTSKDKLEVLADTKEKKYRGKFLPRTDCGNAGNGTGYREDSTTFRIAKQVITKEHPNLLLINFKDPDSFGHANDWDRYLQGIKECDAYVWDLWQHIQNDPAYRNQTTLLVTNDHGRHLDGHGNGFVSHGDNCEGCRHINFYAAGPDFKQNTIISTTYNQTDVAATVAELLSFKMPASEGKVMWDLFKK
jgi:hypothetical protein